MDNPFSVIYLFLALFISGLCAQNAHSYQNLAIAAGEPDFFRNPVTNFTSARFSANDPIYDPATRTVTTTRPYNVTGLDGKTYQANITKTAAADIPKVGAALSKFAQRVGPLSMALATVDLICSLSSICNQSGNWMLTQSADDQVSQLMGGWVANYDSSPIACSSDKDMKACASSVWGNSFDLGSFSYTVFPDRIESAISLKSKTTGTTLGEGKLRKLISNFQPAPPAEPTASDWTAAENKLSSPAGADRLAAELEPLPIKAPSVFSPISVPLGTATTTNKDALGNATGTQQTTRRMEIEDAATEAEPYRVTVKETETVTNYDLNNSPISSTETVKQSDTPTEPPPPEDIEIDFDESVDRDLQTFEVPGLFSYTPFGGAGSCPSDVTENTKFGNVTMSYAPVCRVAEGVRPFVILLAIISAFFIVSGSRQS
ncbi:MAG: hypothetical protein DU481_15190 [Nitrosomonas sp.]|uniref:virulence factor TspB C-terminal domain-related protein n=1 Tax=Nitrosomonas sp. TaxID=42353 RepID=UPI0032EF3B37